MIEGGIHRDHRGYCMIERGIQRSQGLLYDGCIHRDPRGYWLTEGYRENKGYWMTGRDTEITGATG